MPSTKKSVTSGPFGWPVSSWRGNPKSSLFLNELAPRAPAPPSPPVFPSLNDLLLLEQAPKVKPREQGMFDLLLHGQAGPLLSHLMDQPEQDPKMLQNLQEMHGTKKKFEDLTEEEQMAIHQAALEMAQYRPDPPPEKTPRRPKVEFIDDLDAGLTGSPIEPPAAGDPFWWT